MQPGFLEYPVFKEEVQNFIFDNEDINPDLLFFGKDIFSDVPNKELARQIISRKKAKKKFPELYSRKGIIYPGSLSLEQSSSSLAADFKASLVKGNLGTDLTGGFGMDAYSFSKRFNSINYVEADEKLLLIAAHNHKILKADNIRYFKLKSEEFLKTDEAGRGDFFFLDPSRRKLSRKVFRFEDCSPNPVNLLGRLLLPGKQVMIKASPLVDISYALRSLRNVRSVYIVNIKNECKEILFISETGFGFEPKIHVVELPERKAFSFYLSEENNAKVTYGTAGKYLYEPHASLLKSGAFKLVGEKFNLLKVAPNSHLYTGDQIIDDFPGRKLEILGKDRLNQKLIRKLTEKRAEIISRNFPLSANEIRKKTSLKSGGNIFLYCTRSIEGEKIVFICKNLT